MAKTIEFYFDFGSPTAYLAFTQLPTLAASHNAELIWKPVLLGGIFKATANASPMHVPAKGRYMLRDLARFAKRYGVPLNFNPHFASMNSLVLMRIATGLQMRAPEQFLSYVSAMYQAIWVDGVNVGDPAAVAAVMQKAGLDPQQLLALNEDPEVKEQLRNATDAAVERGLFGVPVMFVGDEMFFGQDRLDFVREALQ